MCNLVKGYGFSTTSFELSHSFNSLLYSSYTPLTQWIFLPFAAILHCSSGAATLYNFVVSLLAGLAVLWLLTKRLSPGKLRSFAVLLLVITLPLGYLGTESERPEIPTFMLLLALLAALRQASTTARIAICGVIGGLAFLAEPIGGVVAALLIAGVILLPGPGLGARNSRRMAMLTTVAAITFLAPIAVVVSCYQYQDPTSVARFLHQATERGLTRRAVGDGQFHVQVDSNGPIASAPEQSKAEKYGAGFSRYFEAIRFLKSLGVLAIGTQLAAPIVLLVWFGLCVTSRGRKAGRVALFSIGIFLFIAVFVVFPLQFNYLILARCLFPFVLMLDWAGCSAALHSKQVIELLVIFNLLVLLPGVLVMSLQRAESRVSYAKARQQATFLKSYLVSQGEEDEVILVPATQYYLYKERFHNIFNPSYLSPQHDMQEVVAVVNCNTATKYIQSGEKPVPQRMERSQLRLISPGGNPVSISLLGHKIMSSNWTWTCDLYVAK